MFLIRAILKILATLAGLPLTLGGFFGFWVGIYLAFSDDDPWRGVALCTAAVIALAVGTVFGKYARGDYD